MLASLLRRLRLLFTRDRASAELEEEMRFHLEMRASRFEERGLSSADARHAARRAFGNPAALAEHSRDAWGFTWLEQTAADVRFAARRLITRPGFALSTIVVSALGIGATTSVFSAIDAAILRPLPFAQPDRLVTLTDVDIPLEASGQFPAGRHYLNITDAAAMRGVFSSVAGYAAGGLNLADPEHPRRVQVGVVTSGFFATLGVRPLAGRVFSEEEGRPRGPKSAILSHALWQAMFGGADVVGRTIDLSGNPYRVIGIMPAGFNFPNASDLWIPLPVPLTFDAFTPFRGWIPSYVVGRLASGMTFESASVRALDRWKQLAGPAPANAVGRPDPVAQVAAAGALMPLQRSLVGDTRRALILLLIAAGLLLAIAVSNVANLLLSDAVGRQREVALRQALGASRGRIVRQFLAESVLLAFIGSALGVAAAPLLLRILRAMMPPNLAGVAPVELDLRVLAVATAAAVVTGVLFGFQPARGASRTEPIVAIKSGGGTGATPSGLGKARRLLVTAQLALTVMLLVGSGLMLRSLWKVMSRDVGLNVDGVATVELAFGRAPSAAARLQRINAMLDRLRTDPAVRDAGAVNDLPLRVGGGGGIALGISPDGGAVPDPNDANDPKRFVRMLYASAGYFSAAGIHLLQGSLYPDGRDTVPARVAVISASTARLWWPGLQPIGRTFTWPFPVPTKTTVVGVVGDVRERGLERDLQPQMYFPISDAPPGAIAIVVRGTVPPATLLARLTDAVHAVDPAQAVYNARTMDDLLANSLAPRRTNTSLIGLFGAVALLLSAFGMFAVMSYSVSRRAREFAVRTALGASVESIARLVFADVALMIGFGVALGLAGAWLLAHLLAALLFEVDGHDTLTFIVVPLVLTASALLATVLPVRRAMRVNPMDVMRTE